jgi:hypothetical protein
MRADTRRKATMQNPQRTLRVVDARGIENVLNLPFSSPARTPLTICAKTVERSCCTPRMTKCTVSSSTVCNVGPATRPTTDDECGSGQPEADISEPGSMPARPMVPHWQQRQRHRESDDQRWERYRERALRLGQYHSLSEPLVAISSPSPPVDD